MYIYIYIYYCIILYYIILYYIILYYIILYILYYIIYISHQLSSYWSACSMMHSPANDASSLISSFVHKLSKQGQYGTTILLSTNNSQVILEKSWKVTIGYYWVAWADFLWLYTTYMFSVFPVPSNPFQNLHCPPLSQELPSLSLSLSLCGSHSIAKTSLMRTSAKASMKLCALKASGQPSMLNTSAHRGEARAQAAKIILQPIASYVSADPGRKQRGAHRGINHINGNHVFKSIKLSLRKWGKGVVRRVLLLLPC